MAESKGTIFPDERMWYDQFTSTDWVHDAIADSYRVKQLRSRKDFWGRVRIIFDGAQGWILSALCGFIVALMAYTVDVAESTVFDFKDGYCSRAWYLNRKVSDELASGYRSFPRLYMKIIRLTLAPEMLSRCDLR
jgi:chloride channel 3/4/5